MEQFEEFEKIFGGIDQIGIVVDDIEAVQKAMKDMFGVEPTGSKVVRHNGLVYKGQPQTPAVHIMGYKMFNVELEYLCPVEGDSIWADFLKTHGKGVHHIRFNVTNLQEAIDYMEKQGFEVIQSAEASMGGGCKFCYFDTLEAYGYYIDIINLREIQGD